MPTHVTFNVENLDEMFLLLRGRYWSLRPYDETEIVNPQYVADVGLSWDTETAIADTPLEALIAAANQWEARKKE